MEHPMQKLNDLSRSPSPLDPGGTLIAVIELSLSSWLVAGIVPGVERQPLKKLAVDESALLKLLHRWREEAANAGHRIKRIAVAFEAGRDGFWLARWLSARDIEAHVIHASSVAAGNTLPSSIHGHAARRSALPRERFSPLALFRHGAMSELSPLCAKNGHPMPA
jgi:hypothetical protein